MVRLAVMLLLVLGAQDPADKVKALVEKLKSDEITERETAARDLIKLGTAALPALRRHEEASEGAVKAVLQSVVKRIESAARLDKLLGSAPAVTLDVRDAEIEKVLAEMARQTGFDISGFFLDSSMRVTLKCEGTPVWKAVDDLCRAHGGMAARYTSRSIVVEAGLEPGTPLATHRSLAIQFRPAQRGADGKLELQGVLTYPPGLPVWSTSFEFDELADDLGTSLTVQAPTPEFSVEALFPAQGVAGQFATKVFHRSSSALAKDAMRLRRTRGAVVAKVAVEFKTLLTLADPMKEAETTAEQGGFKMTVTPKRKSDRLQFRIKFVERPDDDDAMDVPFAGDSKRAFGCRDEKGELYVARARSMMFEDPKALQVEVMVPKGREIVSFEMLDVVAFTEVRVPFDYADIPLKAK